MTASNRRRPKSLLAIVLLLVAPGAAADNDSVDIAVEWRPGTYVYLHNVTSELHYAGEQQLMESSAEMRLIVTDEGRDRTRFRVAVKPTESKVDGASLSVLPQDMPETTVLFSGQGNIVEFEVQDATGASSRVGGSFREALAGVVVQPPQFSRANVHTGDRWSTKHADTTVQWTVDQVAELAGLVDLSFRYVGNFVQVPEFAVAQAVGFDATPRQKSLVGQVRVDPINSRLLQMSHQSSVTFDIASPGGILFNDVKIKTKQFMVLDSFEAPTNES